MDPDVIRSDLVADDPENEETHLADALEARIALDQFDDDFFTLVGAVLGGRH